VSDWLLFIYEWFCLSLMVYSSFLHLRDESSWAPCLGPLPFNEANYSLFELGYDLLTGSSGTADKERPPSPCSENDDDLHHGVRFDSYAWREFNKSSADVNNNDDIIIVDTLYDPELKENSTYAYHDDRKSRFKIFEFTERQRKLAEGAKQPKDLDELIFMVSSYSYFVKMISDFRICS